MQIGDGLNIDITKAAGQRIAIIGKSGSGKTNTMGVVVEEWIGAGLPATIIDPMAQFRHINTLLPVIVAGRARGADLEIHPGNATALARLAVRERISIVLDMSLYEDDESMGILQVYVETLWSAIFAEENPAPYLLAVDEAQLYAPQQGKTVLSKTIIDVAKRGRHKNLTTVVATQRAASIVKDFLTQATLLVAHRLSFGVDTAVLREQLPLSEKELNGMMRRLQTGEALVIGDVGLVGDVDYLRIQVRAAHRPLTPLQTASPTDTAARGIDEAIRVALRELAAIPAPESAPSQDVEVEKLREQIRALTEINAGLTDKVAAQEQEIAALRLELKHWKTVQQPLHPTQNGHAEDLDIRRQKREINADQRAVKRQERAFERLRIQANAAMNKQWQRDAMLALIAHDRPMATDELVRKIGIRPATWRPPTGLIRLGLVHREGEGWDSCYAFIGRLKFEEDFPDLDAGALVKQLAED